MRCWVALVAALVCGVASADDQKARADKLFEDGRRFLANKEYQLACTAFEESQKADPAIGTQLNIALCYEEWGHVAAAYHAFVEAEKSATAKKDDRAKGARKKIDELAPKIPHLVVTIPADADPSAVFLFDGKETERDAFKDDMLVEVGHHDIEARVPGRPPAKTSVELKAGEHKALTLDVPKPEVKVQVVAAPPRNSARLYGGIALGGAGVIAMTVAGFVALAARQDYNDAIVNCSDTNVCTNKADFNATNDARSRANQMTFVALGGAALAGVGVYLIFTSAGKKSEKQAVVPLVGPHVTGLAIEGGF